MEQATEIRRLLFNKELPFVDPFLLFPHIVILRLNTFNKALEELRAITSFLENTFSPDYLNRVNLSLESSIYYSGRKKVYLYDIYIFLSQMIIREKLLEFLNKRGFLVLTKEQSWLLANELSRLLNQEASEV